MKSSQKVVVLHVWMASVNRQEISSLVFVCFGSATLLTVTFAVRLTPVSLCVCVNMLIPHCLRRKAGQSLDLTLTKQSAFDWLLRWGEVVSGCCVSQAQLAKGLQLFLGIRKA